MPQDAPSVSFTAPKGSLILDNLHLYRLNFIAFLALHLSFRCTAMLMFIAWHGGYIVRRPSLLLSRPPDAERYRKDVFVRVDMAESAKAGSSIRSFPCSEMSVQEENL